MVRWVLKKWPIKISDDRGREVCLLPPPRFKHSDAKPVWNPKYIGAHWGHRTDFELQTQGGMLYGAATGICLILTIKLAGFLMQGIKFTGKDWVVPFVAGMICWPMFPFFIRNARSRSRDKLRAAYLRACRCPSCDYDLSGQQKEPDGCSMCSECGAAWRMASPPAEVQSTPA
jgi:hypothetical protein